MKDYIITSEKEIELLKYIVDSLDKLATFLEKNEGKESGGSMDAYELRYFISKLLSKMRT